MDKKAPLDLREALKIYVQAHSVRINLGAFCVLAVIRSTLDPISWIDVSIVLGLALAQPLIEWFLHVYILHWQPRNILGVTIDLKASVYHRRHHQDPSDPRWWFIPLSTGFRVLVFIALLAGLLAPSLGTACTSIMATVVFAAFYEWVHYLTHTTYRPRTRWFKRRAKMHRLHHFKNEKYWMGVTGHWGDALMRTLPNPSEIKTSSTARNLLG